ncbi:hypothetical protein K491DRAFT_182417 [Lophiostoma macrostomum CBS 122681]|uniref:Uncharacterized protein n=1 Tax=Lophiostoma macrostomum CBS 122681 TaxID=1314788 RepID=A0A6A6TTD2_9PLEO|nr:hypothetical protein K491DRAFT_182417 [Lophiostoma macrostomum CBS 122681]
MVWAASRADWRETVVHLRALFVAGLADHQQVIGFRVYHRTALSRGALKALGCGRNLHVQKQGILLEAVLRRLRLNSTRFSVCHPRLPLPRLGVTEPVRNNDESSSNRNSWGRRRPSCPQFPRSESTNYGNLNVEVQGKMD